MSNQILICICGHNILKFHWWGHNISTGHKLQSIKQQARHSLQIILSVSCMLATVTVIQNKNSVQGAKGTHQEIPLFSLHSHVHLYYCSQSNNTPYFVKTGQLTKHPFYRRSKKQLFKNLSSLLQMVSLRCFKKFIWNKEESFWKVFFFLCFSCKTDVLWVVPFLEK